VRVGTSIGDITAALYATIGITTALYHRSVTGQGQKVDVGMLDCQVAILENAIARYEMSGTPPGPLGTAHPSITPFQAFRTSDAWIIVAAGNDKLWEALCRALGRDELLSRAEFKTNDLRTEHRTQVETELAKTFGARTAQHWYEVLDKARVPASPINTIDKVLAHPQVQARNMIIETSFSDGRRLKIGGNPIKMSSFDDETQAPPCPTLGKDTAAVLAAMLQLSAAEIQALRESRAIGD
jgi:CoA:oxalate CoA-transferase